MLVAPGREGDMDSMERAINEGAARVNSETGDIYTKTSWAAVDLEPYKRGEKVIAAPRFLPRSEGENLIYPGRPHVFYGESESLKTWAALLACRSVVDAGYRALYVDFEGSEASFVERARACRISDAHIGTSVQYVRPTEPLTGDARSDFWLHELDVLDPALVVLDGVTELYALQGWDINKAEDAARFQKMFSFRGTNVASIAIDHTPKEAGRGALGSQHKRAGLDGAEYLFEPRVRGGRGGTSLSRVSVTKDRHGFVRAWASGGVVGHLEVAPDGVSLKPMPITELLDPRDDALERVMTFLRENPGSSRRVITESTHLGNDRVGDTLSALEVLGRARNDGSRSRGSWVVVEDAS